MIASRHRLELMRHIYNGGGESSGSFDKDEAWSSVMEAGAEPGRAPRLVQTLTPVLPDTMCVPAVSSPRRATLPRCPTPLTASRMLLASI